MTETSQPAQGELFAAPAQTALDSGDVSRHIAANAPKNPYISQQTRDSGLSEIRDGNIRESTIGAVPVNDSWAEREVTPGSPWADPLYKKLSSQEQLEGKGYIARHREQS